MYEVNAKVSLSSLYIIKNDSLSEESFLTSKTRDAFISDINRFFNKKGGLRALVRNRFISIYYYAFF